MENINPEETARNLINSMSIPSAYEYSLRKARGNFPLSTHYSEVNEIIQRIASARMMRKDFGWED